MFYGHEKDRTTTRLAIMNLAVHGLEGKIAGETITYLHRPTQSRRQVRLRDGNPPFNVDLVDAERIYDFVWQRSQTGGFASAGAVR